MRYCVNCGVELPEEANYCSKCGTPNTSYEISKLRNKLKKTRRTLKIGGIFSFLIIVVLLGGLFSTVDSYNKQVEINKQITGELEEFINEIDEVKQLIDKIKFLFYYATLAKQRYGVDDLEDYLSHWQWLEGAYVENKFDCSEMSAHLEYKLENEGYHVIIVSGKSPSGDGKHAWLLVETSEGKYMPIEATTLKIVYWDNPYFDNYFKYDYEFETIQDALKYNYNEFNWWEN